jgi:inner membrane protein
MAQQTIKRHTGLRRNRDGQVGTRSLFALLLVSVAEPLGFTAGYVISAALVSLQGAWFTASITGRVRLTAIFMVVQAVMFAALFIIINLETYALLAGSALLFIALSTVMAATRRIDFGDGGKQVVQRH